MPRRLRNLRRDLEIRFLGWLLARFSDPARESCFPASPEDGARWRVMVEDGGLGWIEWCRWTGNEFDGPQSEQEAERRATEFRRTHPDCAARVEKTLTPRPGHFDEVFEKLLKGPFGAPRPASRSEGDEP